MQNQVGLKNLYRIVSAAHTQYFFKKPRVPRSLLNQYREGLLLSPACEAGELYRAIVAGQPYEQLLRIADYYDYLEVQPLGNNEFMVRNGQVDSIEAIKNFNRTVIKLGEDLHKPVVATGDSTFRSRRTGSTALFCRPATASRTRTTKPRSTSAPRPICWRISAICRRKRRMKLW